MTKGSYYGIVACSAISTPRPIIGGFAVACRCGAGEWFPTHREANAALTLHVDPSTPTAEEAL